MQEQENKTAYERGAFEGKVLQSLENIEATLEAMKADFAKHEMKDETRFAEVIKEVEALKQWKAMVVGMSITLGTLGGAIGGKIADALFK